MPTLDLTNRKSQGELNKLPKPTNEALDNLFVGVDKIVIKEGGVYFDWEFSDFNKDGYLDLVLTYSSNTPLVLELLLFVPATRKFSEEKNFEDFPDPKQIEGTKYYYSYHKSGCADMNWDSDISSSIFSSSTSA